MKTVGDFKNAGLEFVVGDTGIGYRVACAVPFNRSDLWGKEIPKSFAWRENTGEKPSFNGLIDVEHRDGDIFASICINSSDCCDTWAINGDHDGDIIKWRPSLNQPEQNTPNNEAAKPNDKPVFSEIDDLKHELKLHKANSELLASLTEFMVNNNIGAAGESCIDVAIRELSERHNIDTRTPKQKAVDEMSRLISLRARDGAAEVCGELYDANYRKLTTSQAKAYDDKTEYFGEDYKR